MLRTVLVALAGLLGTASFAASPLGIAASNAMTPNLVALPASDFHLETDATEQTVLRFSATSWNDGLGPLELVAGDVVNGKRNVSQRIYNDDGSFSDHPAGSFEWHADHDHFHFGNYALYTLQPIAAPGASERTSSKTTFCIMDTDRVNTRLPGAPKRAQYTRCDRDVQGMSVGWGDTYGYHLAGQEIPVTHSGDYRLLLEFDPKNQLIEGNEGDNVSEVRLRIDLQAGTVERLDGPTRPRPVRAS